MAQTYLPLKDTPPMDELLQACASDDLSQLQTLLADSSHTQTALVHEMLQSEHSRGSILNLKMMFEKAARAGQSQCVDALLQYAHDHDIVYDGLITRDTVLAALDGGNLVVLRHFVTAMPETVNLDLGHAGDPLSQFLHRKKFDHESYFLTHGADPNGQCNGYTGPGYHLRLSAQKLPLAFTKLLLKHGALVPQSGAIQVAAEKGRLDILQVLFEHGTWQ